MKKEVGYSAVISVTLTALLAGFLLSFVYSSFEKDILANNEKTVLNGVKAVIDGADELEGPLTENSSYPYYIVENLSDLFSFFLKQFPILFVINLIHIHHSLLI